MSVWLNIDGAGFRLGLLALAIYFSERAYVTLSEEVHFHQRQTAGLLDLGFL